MPFNPERPVVRIAPNNPGFDLPVIMGIEAGLFGEPGIAEVQPAPAAAEPMGARARMELGGCDNPTRRPRKFPRSGS